MRIRCKNCYRVLNNDEEWCTRCGAHSDEVAELMKSGIEPINEVHIMKSSLLLYLLIAFLVNGLLNVIFGVIFNAMYDNYYYGEVGSNLPNAIVYFSAINSLMVTSIIMAIVAYFVNLKDFNTFLKIKDQKRLLISLIIGLFVSAGLVVLARFTNVTIIPIYFRDFLLEKTPDMTLTGSMKLFKIIVVLVFYGIAEEIIFRKAIIGGMDEATLLPDWQIVILQGLIATVLSALCFLILARLSLVNYLLCLAASLVFNTTMGFCYYYNKKSLVVNLIIRMAIIILAIIII